jgi:hypothetical protein
MDINTIALGAPAGPFLLVVADESSKWRFKKAGIGHCVADLQAGMIKIAQSWVTSKPAQIVNGVRHERSARDTREHGICGIWLYYSDGKPRAFVTFEPVPVNEPHPGDIRIDRTGAK